MKNTYHRRQTASRLERLLADLLAGRRRLRSAQSRIDLGHSFEVQVMPRPRADGFRQAPG